jgi:PPOX class probable F420-dependent enzyme
MIDPAIRDLARGRNFGAFTTILPSGRAMTHVMWVDADDDHLLINTEVHRQKFKNVQRDPRVTVTIWDADNSYTFGELRGDVVETITGPEARAHIDALSHRYMGTDYRGHITSERVILKIAAAQQNYRPSA